MGGYRRREGDSRLAAVAVLLQSCLAECGRASGVAWTDHAAMSGLVFAQAPGRLNHCCRLRCRSARHPASLNMKLNFQNERVLAVVAHPDDAELLCAGTLARARYDGAEIGICVLCRGDKGQPGNAVANLSAVRRKEMTAAAKLLGAKLYSGQNPDGMLVDGASQRLKLVETYRQFKPTLVLAHALEDYHPDHRSAGVLAEAASWFCASRGFQDSCTRADFTPRVVVDGHNKHEQLQSGVLRGYLGPHADQDANVGLPQKPVAARE